MNERKILISSLILKMMFLFSLLSLAFKKVAGFLRHELPIRLAHRIQDLERVPFMKEMKSVQQVKELYITSFLELISIDKNIANVQDEEKFALMLEGIYERHSSVLVQMARGAFELRAGVRNGTINFDSSYTSQQHQHHHHQHHHQHQQHYYHDSNINRKKVSFDMMEETHAFLDRFYISRIGIRVLIGQYLSLRQKPVPNYIGLICLHSSPYEIVQRAIDDAAFMCARKYGDSPEVIITGRLDLTFPYVPTHLRKYIQLYSYLLYVYFVCSMETTFSILLLLHRLNHYHSCSVCFLYYIIYYIL